MGYKLGIKASFIYGTVWYLIRSDPIRFPAVLVQYSALRAQPSPALSRVLFPKLLFPSPSIPSLFWLSSRHAMPCARLLRGLKNRKGDHSHLHREKKKRNCAVANRKNHHALHDILRTSQVKPHTRSPLTLHPSPPPLGVPTPISTPSNISAPVPPLPQKL